MKKLNFLQILLICLCYFRKDEALRAEVAVWKTATAVILAFDMFILTFQIVTRLLYATQRDDLIVTVKCSAIQDA